MAVNFFGGRGDFAVYSWNDVLKGGFAHGGKKTALTVGVFDGPHIGHRLLMDSVLNFASGGKDVDAGVVTFDGMEKTSDGKTAKMVSTMEQRLDFLRSKGFAFAIVIDFSVDFSKIEGHDFISLLTKNCGMAFLCEGDDFRCGYKGSCGVEQINALSRALSFEFQVKQSVVFKELKVSSTRIRRDVREARFDDAAAMLERPYSLDCQNLRGAWEADGIWLCAREDDFLQEMPKDGTYAVTVRAPEKSFKSELRVRDGRAAVRIGDALEGAQLAEIVFDV
jgi:FAD synthase